MLGRAHVGGSKAARDIVRRMAGAAVRAIQVRDMRRGRIGRRFGVRRIVIETQLRGFAVAQGAIARDSGMQHRDACQGLIAGRCAGDRGVADRAALAAGIGHVTHRQHRGFPISRVVADRTVTADHLRVGTREVIRRPRLQRGS